LCLAVFAFPYAIRFVSAARHGERRWTVVAALICLGWTYQQGLALVEHRGAQVMRDRLLATGHAEFVVTASRDIDVWQMVVNYEEFVKAPDQEYARSKPPGQLLFYCAAAAIADRIMPLIWDPPIPPDARIKSVRHFRLINFATLFFPMIGLLALFPLTDLGRTFLGERRQLWPALLYLLAPAPTLVQMHLDQVLYPALAASFWALCARGRSLVHWAMAGAIAWVSFFISFSMLPMIIVGAGIALAPVIRQPSRAGFRAVILGALVAFGVALALSVLAYFALHYDPFAAYARCLEHHVRWKRWDASYRWRAARLDLIEFGYWLGPPLGLLFLSQAFYGIRRLWMHPPSVMASATLLALLLVATFGKTIAEVARLWLFFVPAVVLAASARLQRVRAASPEARLGAVTLLQLVWTFSLKAMQDFY